MTLRKPPFSKSSKIKFNEVSVGSTNNETPIFSFEHMVTGFCVQHCEEIERAQFALALFKRSKLTWQQLQVLHHHKLGLEEISKKSIKVGIPNIVTDDVKIIAFRCFNMMPMIGFRNDRVFNVLWLDPKGKVYDHE